ncbi:hypothetical protein L2E82_20466 [Cichorium intybus]|uniref:Uncharacterized protein n=1 Tax=Cichorium intybus TaxID=13427 RepID=A0ACB9DT38_CICIN|nr:hypothetical protein L2E82_20466 [Cichorium intybus]
MGVKIGDFARKRAVSDFKAMRRAGKDPLGVGWKWCRIDGCGRRYNRWLMVALEAFLMVMQVVGIGGMCFWFLGYASWGKGVMRKGCRHVTLL